MAHALDPRFSFASAKPLSSSVAPSMAWLTAFWQCQQRAPRVAATLKRFNGGGGVRVLLVDGPMGEPAVQTVPSGTKSFEQHEWYKYVIENLCFTWRSPPPPPPQAPPQAEPQIQPQAPPQAEPQIQPQAEPQIQPQAEPQIPPQAEPQIQIQALQKTKPPSGVASQFVFKFRSANNGDVSRPTCSMLADFLKVLYSPLYGASMATP